MRKSSFIAIITAFGSVLFTSTPAIAVGPGYTVDDSRPLSVLSVCYLQSPSNDQASQPQLDALCELFQAAQDGSEDDRSDARKGAAAKRDLRR